MNQRLHCKPGFRAGGDSSGAAVLKRNRPALAACHVLESRLSLAGVPDRASEPGGVWRKGKAAQVNAEDFPKPSLGYESLIPTLFFGADSPRAQASAHGCRESDSVMIRAIASFISQKPKAQMTCTQAEAAPAFGLRARATNPDRRQTYSRAFRWRVLGEQTPKPSNVEVVGSFSNWKRVPMAFDVPTQTWQVNVLEIEGNRTHHYVFLVDGKPAYDKTCDGLALPQGPHEEQWQIETAKGPRVMLLFGQAK